MTKAISARNVRQLRRELRLVRTTVCQRSQKESVVAKRTRTKEAMYQTSIASFKARTVLLCKSVRTLEAMFGEQQSVIRRLQSQLRDTLQQKSNRKPSPTLETALTMIALSEQLCAHCLGTRHILKINKNQRFSVECKACQT